MGKAKASKHSVTGGTKERTVPIVGFDYASKSARAGAKPENVDEGHQANDEDAVIKVLIGHDSRPKACAAIPVPQKAIDPDEYTVRESLEDRDSLGYQTLVVETDQDRALNAAIRR